MAVWIHSNFPVHQQVITLFIHEVFLTDELIDLLKDANQI